MSRRLFAVSAVLACACGSSVTQTQPPPPPGLCQPLGDFTLLDEPELYVNQPATVQLAGRFIGCDGGPLASPAEVKVALSDPADRPLPFTVDAGSLPYQDDGSLSQAFGTTFAAKTLLLADVTFQPSQLGLYHLIARFQPSLGTVQADLMVMIDGRGAMNEVSVGAPCDWFETWNGMQLCLWSDAGVPGIVDVQRDGAPITQLQASTALVSNAGLWTYEIDGLLSLTTFLPDGGPLLLAQAPLPAPFDTIDFDWLAPVLAADQDQLLVFKRDTLLLARPAGDGGLTLTPAGTLPVQFSRLSSATLRADEGAAVGGDSTGATNFCVVSFADGGIDCSAGPAVYGRDHDVLWMLDHLSNQLSAWTLGPGLTVSKKNAVFSEQPQPPSPVMPAITDQTQFVFFDSAMLGYRVDSLYSVSPHHVMRLPTLAPEPALIGYGRWPGAQPTTQPPPALHLGASAGTVWWYDGESGRVRYQRR